jgi:ankyrin repeat protein
MNGGVIMLTFEEMRELNGWKDGILRYFIKGQKWKRLLECLGDGTIDVGILNERDSYGESVAFCVWDFNKLKGAKGFRILNTLKGFGLDFESINNYGKSPLFYACREARLNFIDYYIQMELDPSLQDRECLLASHRESVKRRIFPYMEKWLGRELTIREKEKNF